MGWVFRRGDDGTIDWLCQPFEVGLLESLASQLVELYEPPVWSDDPLERWANEQDAEPLDRTDPAIRRLFPDAYDDTDEASDHRRLVEGEQRSARAAEAEVVRAAVSSLAEQAHPMIRIPLAQQLVWLKVLNAMRLALGSRLGIHDEADAEAIEGLEDDDPRRAVADVYEWLGYVQSSLLEFMTA